ncbi:ceramidase domain-containing protein [Flavitalea flava]
MKQSTKLFFLALLTLIAIVVVFRHSTYPQASSYHDLAGKRIILGIRNGWNVLSNLPFVLVGIFGLGLLRKANGSPGIKTVYAILFTGIFLVGWGSAYYHYTPGNNTLIFDRIPMTVVFMALLSATIAEHIHEKAGVLIVWPLIALGLVSALYWYYTESIGKGDLRLYGLVQYYPMVFLPLILLLFPAPVYNRGLWQLPGAIICYAVAKIFEHYDKEIYSLTGFVSGHTLKHLAAAAATYYLVRMFQRNYCFQKIFA